MVQRGAEDTGVQEVSDFPQDTASIEARYEAAPSLLKRDAMHFNGSTRLVIWMLGIFGSVMIVLLTLVLQAIYSTNGAVNKLAGQQISSQTQIQSMQQEIAAVQAEMMGLAGRNP